MARRRGFFSEVIKTVTIQGETYEIRVNCDGEFRCTVGLDHLTSDRLADILKRVRSSAKKQMVELAIPATVVGDRREDEGTRLRAPVAACHDILINGLNVKTHAIRFKYMDGGQRTERERFGSYGDFAFCHPMPADAKAEWVRLRDARVAAREAFDTFVAQYEWKDVFGDVKQAMADATDDPKEAAEPPTDPR